MEELKKRLKKKKWFLASSAKVRKQLLNLSPDCEGFLQDLLERPDEIGGLRVLAMSELLIPTSRPIFGILPVFKVQKIDNPKIIFNYQYFSWKQGARCGVKGLVLIRQANAITHFVFLRCEKFAIGGMGNDCPGGFLESGEKNKNELEERFKIEIKEELGVGDIKIDEIIDLGRLRVDSSTTSSYPYLFVAIINGDEAKKLDHGNEENPDVTEVKLKTILSPVERLGEAIASNDDSFFLACVLRLREKKILH